MAEISVSTRLNKTEANFFTVVPYKKQIRRFEAACPL
jgi:hypothetical protein